MSVYKMYANKLVDDELYHNGIRKRFDENQIQEMYDRCLNNYQVNQMDPELAAKEAMQFIMNKYNIK